VAIDESLKHRIGKVKVSEDFMWNVTIFQALFKDCVILDIVSHDYHRYRVYVCASLEFDRLQDSEPTPEYTAIITSYEHGAKVVRDKWERVT
jgi:hypothetical protein